MGLERISLNVTFSVEGERSLAAVRELIGLSTGYEATSQKPFSNCDDLCSEMWSPFCQRSCITAELERRAAANRSSFVMPGGQSMTSLLSILKEVIARSQSGEGTECPKSGSEVAQTDEPQSSGEAEQSVRPQDADETEQPATPQAAEETGQPQ